ncbi:MAG: NosD domain-containing protein [Candidatus Thorarchaeota archaeon]|jgi:parallel beta-helix repeat protein
MHKWKPTVVVFVLVIASSFGVFTIFGTEVATGTIVGGNISIDTLWVPGGSPYIVMENVIVDPGVTLTIEPGVDVKFDPPGMHDYLNIYVEGWLVSVGLSDVPINFTSNAGIPGNDWGAVQINSTGVADIRNCSFTYGDGIVLASTSPHDVIENVFSWDAGIETRTSNHHIANNTLASNGHIYILSSNNTVQENDLYNTRILILSPSNFILRNNIDGVGAVSKLIDIDSSDNVVANNTILDDGDDTGIDIYGDDNTIVANSITGADEGVHATKIGNIIANNRIIDSQRGVTLSVADGNRIDGNIISGSKWGIYILTCPNENTITNNRIESSTTNGIYAQNSWNNLIYHNMIVENQIQAYDLTGGNLWDNGYPMGGNHWSNYSGIDQYSGPTQSVLGPDGIGDTPYLLDIGSSDRYPLMESIVGNLPPRNMNAHLSGMNYENITVSWNLSWNDGQRANDTTGYEIFRSSVYDFGKSGYASIASVPNRTTQFTDIFSGKGNPDNFFYYVCAINGTGNYSCTEGQVGKFTRNLTKGWNLVSLPLMVDENSLKEALRATRLLGIRQYDANNPQNVWREYSSLKPYEEVVAANISMGYWLNVDNDSAMVIAGKVPTSVTISLKFGWNLVGYPSFSRQSIGSSFLGLPLEGIEGFNESSQPYHLQDLRLIDGLKEGEGYWIKVSSDCLWQVEN